MSLLDISPQLRNIRSLHAQGQHIAARVVTEALIERAPHIRCPACKGAGRWAEQPDPRAGATFGTCTTCDGTGLVCPSCASSGWVVQPWSTNQPHADVVRCPVCWSTDEEGEYYPNRMKAIHAFTKEVQHYRPDLSRSHDGEDQASSQGGASIHGGTNDDDPGDPWNVPSARIHGSSREQRERSFGVRGGLRRFSGEPIPFPGRGPGVDHEPRGGDEAPGGI